MKVRTYVRTGWDASRLIEERKTEIDININTCRNTYM